MSGAGPSADRFTPQDVKGEEDAVLLPPSNKFGFAWPSDFMGHPLADHVVRPRSAEPENIPEAASPTELPPAAGEATRALTPDPHSSAAQTSYPARFSRAFTMPLPSQLRHLRNPRRTPSTWNSTSTPIVEHAPGHSHFHEVSLELADSVQTVVQMLLQVSPHQLLDPVKEQFSACSLSIPTPSVSAMLTSMKNLNYISANMANFCTDSLESGNGSSVLLPSVTHNDFDIGEMLQSVGDVLSGSASQVGSDLVLFHGDVAMKHVSVRGDENGVSFALSHVARQVINTARRGDTLEIGLFLATVLPSKTTPTTESLDHNTLPPKSSPLETNELRCTFEITHKFASPECHPEGTPDGSHASDRPHPLFSTLLLRRLLRQIGASLVPRAEPKSLSNERSWELTIALQRGSSPSAKTPLPEVPNGGPPHSEVDDPFANEPSLEELLHFAETLRGNKVTLYASTKGSFAHHLTSYLTEWGLDVSHVSLGTGQEAEAPKGEAEQLDIDPSAVVTGERRTLSENVATGSKADAARSFSFVFIDDHVDVLRNRLDELRCERAHHRSAYLRKRPPLSIHHKPLSSQHSSRQKQLPAAASSVVVMHFTSLSNYKPVKDVIQSILASYPPGSIPEVMIIPKPAGPRRVLTALYTAVTKPVVDPFFVPTATSPFTPSHSESSFFSAGTSKSPAPRPPGSRSNSTRSPKDPIIESHLPPSPLGIADNMEYFTEAASKLGSSLSRGLVIQSPDGQPAGIFFNPSAKSSRSSSSNERDRGQFLDAQRSGPSPRRVSETIMPETGMLSAMPASLSFSSLHAGSAVSPPAEVPITVTTSQDPTPTASTDTKQTQSSANSLLDVPIAIPFEEQSPATAVTAQKMFPASPSAEPGPSSPNGAARRHTPRRSFQDSKASRSPSSVARKGKSPADANVVPPISVLIVDDNPINQTILSTWMKKRQIKYDVAMNGLEAVQKWRTGGFHLILMDIQMPVMDGIEATKEIRRLEKINAAAGYPPSTPSEEGTPRTPSESTTDSRTTTSPYRSSVIIVALTASSLQSDRVAALAAGCNDFLTKPVSLVWLNSKIIEWGSIKALQMWADLRPEVVKTISTEQVAQARNVAQRLHVPEGRSSPSRSRSSSVSKPLVPLNLKDTPEATAPIGQAKRRMTYPLLPPPSASADASISERDTHSRTEAESDSAGPNEEGKSPPATSEPMNPEGSLEEPVPPPEPRGPLDARLR